MGERTGTPTLLRKTGPSGGDRAQCRTIQAPVKGGWSEPALFEWELRAEAWTDEHPHTEYNFVIEGCLFVESGGVTVEAHAGDVVLVPAGAIGKYWAPEYARLLAIYGPSAGGTSRQLGYEKLQAK